jgi:hypothetical protein
MELTNLNINVIGIFYDQLSRNLKYCGNRFRGNIRLVIKIIEFFIMKDPSTSMQSIVQYDV